LATDHPALVETVSPEDLISWIQVEKAPGRDQSD
jgi:hypothetical protein